MDASVAGQLPNGASHARRWARAWWLYLLALSLFAGYRSFAANAAAESMALVRGDGTLELRPAGSGPDGVGKLYLHGPQWQQVQTSAAVERRDDVGDGWRTLAGALTIPVSEQRQLHFINKFSRVDDGLEVDIDLRFRREAQLQACSWALFWEIAALAEEPVWVIDAEGNNHRVEMPRHYAGRMVLWQGEAKGLKLEGRMPLELSIDKALPLVIQDNREYSIHSFEFRFNFVRGGRVAAGERHAAAFHIDFREPTRVILEETEATSETDTSNWIRWLVPWDNAPVNLGHLNHRPAGAHGFLSVDGDRFRFEDGTEARFWATNISAEANFPDKEQAPAIAARLAAYGINLVRIHHADAPWSARSFIDYSQGSSRAVNTVNLDRFHYFASELKKRGIYIYLDHLVHRRFTEADGVAAAADLPPAGKPYALFDERLIELQKEYSRMLCATVNPYTGLAPAQDPQYALMLYANEQDFFTQQVVLEPYRGQLEEAYRAWAREARIYVGGGKIDFTRPNDTMIRFFVQMQRRYYATMRAFFRDELGVRVPITGSNWARTAALLYTLQDVDFTEAHAYADHPWGEPQQVRNVRTTGERRNIFGNFAFNRLAEKPFMAMEWDQSWPNEWRAELPLLAAAVSALQDYNGVGVYTYRHATAPAGHIEAPFEAALDPARFGLFHHAALLFRRDVKPAQRTVTVALDAVRSTSASALAEWDRPAALTAGPELHRLQMRFYDDPAEALAQAGDTPAVIAPQTALLPPEATAVRSDTAQLWRSWDIGYGTIDTPGTQAVYGRRGLVTRVELSALTADIRTPFATVALSSLTEAPITASEELLLTAVGRTENSGMVYNIFRSSIVEQGSAPMLLEPIRGEIAIRTELEDLRVFAIGPTGERLQRIPSTWEDGVLHFRIGEPALTMHYRLQR